MDLILVVGFSTNFPVTEQVLMEMVHSFNKTMIIKYFTKSVVLPVTVQQFLV